jgi:hypothetical protein
MAICMGVSFALTGNEGGAAGVLATALPASAEAASFSFSSLCFWRFLFFAFLLSDVSFFSSVAGFSLSSPSTTVFSSSAPGAAASSPGSVFFSILCFLGAFLT